MRGISRLASNPSASQEGLCFMECVSEYVSKGTDYINLTQIGTGRGLL
jgi:hypothetical protein